MGTAFAMAGVTTTNGTIAGSSAGTPEGPVPEENSDRQPQEGDADSNYGEYDFHEQSYETI